MTWHGQHRARGLSEDLFCHGSEHQAVKAGQAVSAEHEKVARQRVRVRSVAGSHAGAGNATGVEYAIAGVRLAT